MRNHNEESGGHACMDRCLIKNVSEAEPGWKNFCS